MTLKSVCHAGQVSNICLILQEVCQRCHRQGTRPESQPRRDGQLSETGRPHSRRPSQDLPQGALPSSHDLPAIRQYPSLRWYILHTILQQTSTVQHNCFADIPRESRLNYCQDLVIKKLPDQNYVVLKYLMEFLCLVTDRFAVKTSLNICLSLTFRCDMNKMTAANLAVVFGPNLAWPNDKVKLS